MQLQNFDQTIPGHTKPYHDNSDQISQNFTISTKCHNVDQISHFSPNFTKSTKFHNLKKITIFINLDNTDNADNVDNADNADLCRQLGQFLLTIKPCFAR